MVRAYLNPFDINEDPSNLPVPVPVPEATPDSRVYESGRTKPRRPVSKVLPDAEGNSTIYPEDVPTTPVPSGPIPTPDASLPVAPPVPVAPPMPQGPPRHTPSFSGGAADEAGIYTNYRFGPGAPIVGAPAPAGTPSAAAGGPLSEEELMRAMRSGMGR